jgi:hypothetical protein
MNLDLIPFLNQLLTLVSLTLSGTYNGLEEFVVALEKIAAQVRVQLARQRAADSTWTQEPPL